MKILVLLMTIVFSSSAVLGHNRVVVVPLGGPSPQFIAMNIVGSAPSQATIGGKHVTATLDTDLTVDANGVVNGSATVSWPDGQPSSTITVVNGALVVTTGAAAIDLLSGGQEENWLIDGESFVPANAIGQILEEVTITAFASWSTLALNYAAIAVLVNLPAWQVNSVIAQQISNSPSIWCKAYVATIVGLLVAALITGCAAAVAACAAGTVVTIGGVGVPCAFVAVACSSAVLGGSLTAISIIVYEAILEFMWGSQNTGIA